MTGVSGLDSVACHENVVLVYVSRTTAEYAGCHPVRPQSLSLAGVEGRNNLDFDLVIDGFLQSDTEVFLLRPRKKKFGSAPGPLGLSDFILLL